MLRDFLVLALILAIFGSFLDAFPYENIYQVLAPRFRRGEGLMRSFDGGESQYLQNLLENLKPRF